MIAAVELHSILAFGLVIGIHISPAQLVGLLATGTVVAFFGGAFGVLVLAFLNNQRAANQIFPFVFLPQFFLAGVFTPIQVLPWYLDIPSRIAPLRYAVDFVRGVFYAGTTDYDKVVLQDPAANFAVIGPAFLVCLVIGTFFFVRAERNR